MTAEELKKLRKKLGLTQKEMAERMGISLRAYQYKEAGQRQISRQDEMILQGVRNTP